MEPAMRNAGIHANTHLEVHRMYNAVGIDISKGRSTVSVLQPGGTVTVSYTHLVHQLPAVQKSSLRFHLSVQHLVNHVKNLLFQFPSLHPFSSLIHYNCNPVTGHVRHRQRHFQTALSLSLIHI